MAKRKKLTEDEKAGVRHQVERGLDCQFEMYSWKNMIDDLGLTGRERDYALNELCYTVKEIGSKVIIEVSGGVADVTQHPYGVEVAIIDHDSHNCRLKKCK